MIRDGEVWFIERRKEEGGIVWYLSWYVISFTGNVLSRKCLEICVPLNVHAETHIYIIMKG